MLTALSDQDTLIVSDAHIHPSLTDGARLSRSPVQICPHSDLDALLVVDEAHGIGVAGAGRGAVHAAALADAEHVVVTETLSKALGAHPS